MIFLFTLFSVSFLNALIQHSNERQKKEKWDQIKPVLLIYPTSILSFNLWAENVGKTWRKKQHRYENIFCHFIWYITTKSALYKHLHSVGKSPFTGVRFIKSCPAKLKYLCFFLKEASSSSWSISSLKQLVCLKTSLTKYKKIRHMININISRIIKLLNIFLHTFHSCIADFYV